MYQPCMSDEASGVGSCRPHRTRSYCGCTRSSGWPQEPPRVARRSPLAGEAGPLGGTHAGGDGVPWPAAGEIFLFFFFACVEPVCCEREFFSLNSSLREFLLVFIRISRIATMRHARSRSSRTRLATACARMSEACMARDEFAQSTMPSRWIVSSILEHRPPAATARRLL